LYAIILLAVVLPALPSAQAQTAAVVVAKPRALAVPARKELS
jgi:hypothetical protein